MSDQPEQAATPADEPSETATAPAAPPRPAMRVPRHGRGQLLVSGQPGNRVAGQGTDRRYPTDLDRALRRLLRDNTLHGR